MKFHNSDELKAYLKCQEDLYCPDLETFATYLVYGNVLLMNCSLKKAKDAIYQSLINETYGLPYMCINGRCQKPKGL